MSEGSLPLTHGFEDFLTARARLNVGYISLADVWKGDESSQEERTALNLTTCGTHNGIKAHTQWKFSGIDQLGLCSWKGY